MILSANDIAIIKEYFKQQPVLKAFLFGSFARNEASADSDIDILVDLDYSKHIGLGLGFMNMKFELEDKLKRNIDIVSSKAVSKYISPFINKDKQLIYER